MIHWKEFNGYDKCKSDTIYNLDIEVTSYWRKSDGSVIVYDSSISSDDYNECLEPGAVVYIWMFGIDETVVYGRELDELPEFLQLVRNAFEGDGFIFVHNLAYEFQFMRNVLDIQEVFARTLRKPMKFFASGFEWRCSYMLTRLSLADWGDSLGIAKQKDIMNYNVMRTPLTKLDADTLKYCKYDILIMYAGIKKFVAKYGTIEKIPLTQTGEVRRVVQEMFKKDNGHRFRVTDLQPKTVNQYKRLRSVFAGGDTHANRKNACKIHKNVGSFDKTSDYPYQMCAMKYPSTPFKKVSNNLKVIDPEKYAYIIMLHLTGVSSKTSNTYISRSHCVQVKNGRYEEDKDGKLKRVDIDLYDNGRIINALEVTIAVTEQDLWIIEQTYNIEKVQVIAVFRSRKKYLPKKYIEYILELYAYKTSLKGIKGKEELYGQSKQYINSLYGLMVTDILMPDIVYKDNEWKTPAPMTESIVQDKLNKIQDAWYKNTVAYQWGVWVTAYARRELWEMILYCGDDECYHDTDSVKMLHYQKYLEEFKRKDAVMDQRLRDMCDFYDIDFELTRPLKPNGKPAPLGHWDFEGVYKRARFEGAKRYAYENQTGDIHITVSGVPKSAGKQLDSLKQFKDGLVFNRETCGKKLLTYLDECNCCCLMPDGYMVHHSFGINMRNNGYTMGLEDYSTMVAEINEHKGIIKYNVN